MATWGQLEAGMKVLYPDDEERAEQSPLYLDQDSNFRVFGYENKSKEEVEQAMAQIGWYWEQRLKCWAIYG